MKPQYFLFLPLLWSFGFALGMATLKRAIDCGTGPLRIAFMNNLAVGLLFLPGWAFFPAHVTLGMLIWPLAASVIYFIGQVCTFMAMLTGDVTIIAPAMGVKVVFVAVFTALLGAGVMPLTWWAAACLAAAAVFLLGMSNWHDRRRIARTAILSVVAAGMYGWCDVITQIHAPALGALAFSAVMMGGVSVGSFLLIPYFSEPLSAIPRKALPWAIAGSIISAVQSGGMAFTLGHFGEATAVNVIYSTRGLWSVLLIWLAGPWFGNREHEAGKDVMARRLAGALLLLVAVGLVLY